MAAPQESAEQKAAKEREAAEAKAAEEKAAAEAAAAEEAATPVGYKVTGAAVVLRTKDKAERYLYRGAVIPDGVFTEDSIKHGLSIGLIEKSK